MRLSVLHVAFPLAPVGPDAVGGSEQILTALDRALTDAGHQSIVVACEGSEIAGRLVSVPAVPGPFDARAVTTARAHATAAIDEALAHWPVDIVHMHGFDYDFYLPPPGVPVLATLHCPADWYSPAALHPTRPDTWLHGVSQRQHATLPDGPWLLSPIENGIDLDAFGAAHAKRNFALVLSRIAPDKGIHIALRAAERARMPLLIAGQVFPYADHLRYFDEEVKPRLSAERRYIGALDFARKRRFLAAAHCLLLPSTAAETSSLVAREALASGTPVVAFARGALVDTIEDGRTGFLVTSEDEFADRLRRVATLDPHACRRAALARFPLDRMIAAYMDVYRRLVDTRRSHVRTARRA